MNHIETIILQLLVNISMIRHRLSELQADALGRYIDDLCPTQEDVLTTSTADDQWDIIRDIVVIIGRVYQAIPPDLHAYTFQDYKPAIEYALGLGYAPKSEVEFYCRCIEPELLACREQARKLGGNYANTTGNHHPSSSSI